MEVSGINNSFISNNYNAQTVQNTYLNSRFSAVPVKNTTVQIFGTDTSLSLLTGVMEKKINDFQAIGNLTGLQDKDLDGLKDLINKLSSLKENLNLGNLGQALIDLKSIGNDNYALRQRLLNIQELRENEQSVAIRSYMLSLYDKVYEKKIQSLGIDVYY
jgi:hypothetical protein